MSSRSGAAHRVEARPSEREARSVLRERLEARRGEIEQAALTRVNAIADSSEAADPSYAQGLREAVVAALDYALATIGRGEGGGPPIPVALRAQARIAARNGIGLDTVLRRYMAGYSLLGYFILDEASKDELMDGAELQRLLGAHVGLFDRLLAAVGEEHVRESESVTETPAQRQAEQIERLLAGEILEPVGLPYDFEGRHVGVGVSGPDGEQAIRELARRLECRSLALHRDDGTTWGWLGARRRIDAADLIDAAAALPSTEARLAVGEPGEGPAGWRLTHRQAAAALPVAVRGPDRLVRYADVALLASVVRDDLLVASLRRLYLEPLEGERDGGRTARETLRSYFAAERNGASAAAVLGVSRQTVTNRLRAIEECVGRPLGACANELEVSLRLEDLDNVKAGSRPSSTWKGIEPSPAERLRPHTKPCS